jgi:hypothetical protein
MEGESTHLGKVRPRSPLCCLSHPPSVPRIAAISALLSAICRHPWQLCPRPQITRIFMAVTPRSPLCSPSRFLAPTPLQSAPLCAPLCNPPPSMAALSAPTNRAQIHGSRLSARAPTQSSLSPSMVALSARIHASRYHILTGCLGRASFSRSHQKRGQKGHQILLARAQPRSRVQATFPLEHPRNHHRRLPLALLFPFHSSAPRPREHRMPSAQGAACSR